MIQKFAKSFFVIMAMLIGVTFSSYAADWVQIGGSVETEDGTPLCAMVLANGQHMFSCEPAGKYSLNVPLDSNGQITLFAFCDGLMPFKITLNREQTDYNIIMAVCNSGTQKCVNTDCMLGKWHFYYTVGSNCFEQTYNLNQVKQDDDGNNLIIGTDKNGDLVIADYYEDKGYWVLLDQDILFDRFFIFHSDGNIILKDSFYSQAVDGDITGAAYLSGYKETSEKRNRKITPDENFEGNKELYWLLKDNAIQAD